jgi:chitin disaccharide deacetylase
MKVFFHSDDACLTAESTSQILQCWKDGFLDGFSVLANEDLLFVAAGEMKKYHDTTARLSVHLNITDLKPCLPPTELPLLVTEKGSFRVSFLNALWIVSVGGKRKQNFLEQIYKEWDAQIRLVKNIITSHEVTGLDSHNHLHMIPSLFSIVLQLAEKHNIKWVRVPVELFHLSSMKDLLNWFYYRNLVKWLVLNLFAFLSGARRTLKMQKAMGVLYSGNMFQENVKTGLFIARRKESDSMEVIFHVGKSNAAELKDMVASKSAIQFFSSEKREKEYRAAQNLKNEREGADHNY